MLYAFNGQFLTDSLLVSLPANTFSFGLDVVLPSPSVNNAYTFFGYDSATSPITSVALQIANGIGSPVPVIDNFTVVPEPSTWLAAALALGVIGFSQRKRVRARASFAVKKHF